MLRTTPPISATLFTHFDSQLGRVLLTSREGKLSGLYFVDQPHVPAIAADWIEEDSVEIFVRTRAQLDRYAAGTRQDFALPVTFSGTPFQVLVWNEISAIPFGQTISYSELAQRVGSLQAVRAVGTATGANPISWIIPCHRVVGKDGATTGYAGGLLRKTALLQFEAAMAAGTETVLAAELQTA